MTRQLSLPRDRISVLLLEGISQMRRGLFFVIRLHQPHSSAEGAR